MPVPPYNITVTVTGGSDPSVRCSPNVADIAHGVQQNIVWNLATPGYTFGPKGVYFKSSDDPPWPGAAPARVSDTVYSVLDDNENETPDPIRYPYSLEVTDGTTVIEWDPQVKNEPPP
jgi:hypothetical protein